MTNVENANREIKVFINKYVGKPATPEIKQEILDGVSEILYLHKINYLEPYFDKDNQVRYRDKTIPLRNVIETVLFMICFVVLVLYIVVSPWKDCLIFSSVMLVGYLLNKLAKRDLKKIEAEKYGLTPEEYDKFS